MRTRTHMLLVLLALIAVSASADTERCTIATRSDSVIREACDRGGRDEARRTMRQIVKDAFKRGLADYKCTRCHRDVDTYELLENARDDLAHVLGRLRADAR